MRRPVKKSWKSLKKYIHQNTYLYYDPEEGGLFVYVVGYQDMSFSMSSYLSHKSNEMTKRLYDCLSGEYILYKGNGIFYTITSLANLEHVIGSACEIIDIK